MTAAGLLVTGHGWLVAGGLAIGGVGVLAAVLSLRDASFYAGSQEPCTAIDRLPTYASPPNGFTRFEEEGDRMAAEGTRQEFEQIVERLTADYPSLTHEGLPWPRPVLITMLSVGGVAWGLLSVAMVAWGWRGVVLTGVVAALAAGGVAVDLHRRRRVR
ncbi:hypothetical protein [Paractinoplanes rishiriensis]|uniref:Uncharacterized protein n=1 Tax=Paractinoplanes rishiriensis TaxID=1050105 RepID=A0A919JQQ9_9ACTN|nr:hypothetical protein [Actinoplanes rishiriensis]GIE93013.1 hypothetical protein Ari01nite_04780 [Actinoplanes rishiriensis]